ncbi:dihydropteroate synthase [Salinihabitans flavidus]|uniref:Dihydropteroate synthase n=1 Tax=Salinihabitans flavidus TaxID=569882 RepID=A0A1H8LA66_9RHOB|nr:dihydropteroate synthase [Salinihabitans flavidus]SEO02003.1 dihydropteroate synthase [Salinihabitans flavidus]
MTYYRPIAQTDPARPSGALPLAGGWCWFSHVEVLRRDGPPQVIAAADLPEGWRARLTAPRPALGPLAMDRPQIMGILNVTPDSFSDGGQHAQAGRALSHARAMAEAGAAIIDVGGESTRPGAVDVPAEEEIARTAPVIEAMRREIGVPVSIDTRKATVARAAVAAGAGLFNDVAGFTFDPALLPYAAQTGLPVCVMHARGDPATMQHNPVYEDVLLDVYDYLEARVAALEAAGIPRARIAVDPGIGFGKTIAHNLALLARISLFHGLGCPVLLGASRKKFISVIGKAPDPMGRAPGSVAVALGGIAQGVQITRVHDVEATAQALRLWRAVTLGDW